MSWIALLVAALFALVGLGCLALVVLSLPGTWILLALGVVVELVDVYYLEPPHSTFGWWLLVVCALLAGFGELLEFAAGAAGTKVGGGTRRGMVGALIGGLLGAILLTPLLPIPVVGTLVGALIGTFLGALLAERSHPERRLVAELPPEGASPVPPEQATDAPAEAVAPPVPQPPAAATPPLPGWRRDMRAALGATTGRLLGTLGKLAVGIAVWIALTVAAFWA